MAEKGVDDLDDGAKTVKQLGALVPDRLGMPSLFLAGVGGRPRRNDSSGVYPRRDV